MTLRANLLQMAKAVGADLRNPAGPSRGTLAAGNIVAAAAPVLAECLFAEARRKAAKPDVVTGLAFLFETALDSLRIAANGGDSGAGETIAGVQAAIAHELAQAPVPPQVLLQIAHAFGKAGLDPGAELRAALANDLAHAAPGDPSAAMPPEAIVAELAEAAANLGNDPFVLYREVAASSAALPQEFTAAMARLLVGSGNPVLAEAALGFAFSANPATAAAAVQAMEPPPGGNVPQIVLDRMVRMRPWLTQPRQARIDSALRSLRPKAGPPYAPPQVEMRRILASAIDGSGSQSLFALVRQGKTFALVSLLLKLEEGVADTLVNGGMRKAEADATIRKIVQIAGAVDVSIGLAERRICDALAVNLARDVPPPFGLLQAAESMGLGTLRPQQISPAALAASLLEMAPATLVDDPAALAAHRASADWRDRFAMLDSWFEAGADVEAILRRHKQKKQRVAALLAEHLPKRRQFWAGCCAWMAAVLQDQPKPDPAAWVPFALVARDVAGTMPLEKIPLMAAIAEASARAFRQYR